MPVCCSGVCRSQTSPGFDQTQSRPERYRDGCTSGWFVSHCLCFSVVSLQPVVGSQKSNTEMVKAVQCKQALLQSLPFRQVCCPCRLLRSQVLQGARTGVTWFLKNTISMRFRCSSWLAVNSWALVLGHVYDLVSSPFQEGGGRFVSEHVYCA